MAKDHHKTIAQHIFQALGADRERVKVQEILQDDGSVTAAVFTVDGSDTSDERHYSTIGVSDYLASSKDGKKIRWELATVSASSADAYDKLLGTTSFIARTNPSAVQPGEIREKLFAIYYKSAEATHGLLTSEPLIGPKIPPLKLADFEVRWIYLTPITGDEVQFAQKKGVAALITKLRAKAPDFRDLGRASVCKVA